MNTPAGNMPPVGEMPNAHHVSGVPAVGLVQVPVNSMMPV